GHSPSYSTISGPGIDAVSAVSPNPRRIEPSAASGSCSANRFMSLHGGNDGSPARWAEAGAAAGAPAPSAAFDTARPTPDSTRTSPATVLRARPKNDVDTGTNDLLSNASGPPPPAASRGGTPGRR